MRLSYVSGADDGSRTSGNSFQVNLIGAEAARCLPARDGSGGRQHEFAFGLFTPLLSLFDLGARLLAQDVEGHVRTSGTLAAVQLSSCLTLFSLPSA